MESKKLVTLNLDLQVIRSLKKLADAEAEGNQSLMVRMLIRQAWRARANSTRLDRTQPGAVVDRARIVDVESSCDPQVVDSAGVAVHKMHPPGVFPGDLTMDGQVLGAFQPSQSHRRIENASDTQV